MRLINWIAKVNFVHLCLGKRASVLVRYKVYVYEAYKLDTLYLTKTKSLLPKHR
jgi:hypothetical protein